MHEFNLLIRSNCSQDFVTLLSPVMVLFHIPSIAPRGGQETHFVPYFLGQEQSKLFFSVAFPLVDSLIEAFGS